MPKLLLYSTNTLLAYSITQKYYKKSHYFWCSPHFDARAATRSIMNPPTASPAEIYEGLLQESRRSDFHSAKVAQNRSGILVGATAKKNSGVINDDEFNEIVDAVHRAPPSDFAPLLYVGPYEALKGFAKAPPVAERAHPLSSEFVAENVPRDLFDVIEFPWGGRR